MGIAAALILSWFIAEYLGSKRKIKFWWSFIACLLLSPIIGLIITLCFPKTDVKV